MYVRRCNQNHVKNPKKFAENLTKTGTLGAKAQAVVAEANPKVEEVVGKREIERDHVEEAVEKAVVNHVNAALNHVSAGLNREAVDLNREDVDLNQEDVDPNRENAEAEERRVEMPVRYSTKVLVKVLEEPVEKEEAVKVEEAEEVAVAADLVDQDRNLKRDVADQSLRNAVADRNLERDVADQSPEKDAADRNPKKDVADQGREKAAADPKRDVADQQEKNAMEAKEVTLAKNTINVKRVEKVEGRVLENQEVRKVEKMIAGDRDQKVEEENRDLKVEAKRDREKTMTVRNQDQKVEKERNAEKLTTARNRDRKVEEKRSVAKAMTAKNLAVLLVKSLVLADQRKIGMKMILVEVVVENLDPSEVEAVKVIHAKYLNKDHAKNLDLEDRNQRKVAVSEDQNQRKTNAKIRMRKMTASLNPNRKRERRVLAVREGL